MINLTHAYALLEDGSIEPLWYENGEQRNAYQDEGGSYYLDHDVPFAYGTLRGIAYSHSRIVKTSNVKAILMSTELYVRENHPELLRKDCADDGRTE